MKTSFVLQLALALTFSLSLFASSAKADARGHNAKEFFKTIENYRKSCGTGDCQAPFASKKSFELNQPQTDELQIDVKLNLEQVALVQAEVWADTILEGDYYAEGPARLDTVTSLYENNKLIGYRISYSEKAWYTGDCEFEGDEALLKECSEGRIQESTFVSTDFKTYFRDEDDFAEFQE